MDLMNAGPKLLAKGEWQRERRRYKRSLDSRPMAAAAEWLAASAAKSAVLAVAEAGRERGWEPVAECPW